MSREGQETRYPSVAEPLVEGASLGATLSRSWLAFFGALLALHVGDVVTLVLRAAPSLDRLVGFVALGVVGSTWLATLAAATVGVFFWVGSGALRRLGLPARARALLGALGWAALISALLVLAIRPWVLDADPLHTYWTIPTATLLSTAVVVFTRSRLDRKTYRLAVGLVVIGVFSANAALYRGLYRTLHRALLVAMASLLSTATAPEAAAPGRRALVSIALLVALCHGVLFGDVRRVREVAASHAEVQTHVFDFMHALLDRDGDGYAGLLGGADCDDGDAAILPGACEVASTADDENCNGVDLAAPWERPAVSRSLDDAPPDVYFIVVDTLRADRFPSSASGDVERWRRLIDGSLSFERAYTPYPSTTEAMQALLWSRDPRYLDTSGPDLLGVLAAAGYDVQTWAGASRLPTVVGSPTPFPATPGIHIVMAHATGMSTDHTADIVAEAIDELADVDAPPRARWLHFADPHAPHTHAPRRHTPRRMSFADSYRFEVERCLDHIAALLDALERSERGRRAVVVFFGDHGEELGERPGVFHHNAFVWETSVRVPLLMRLPGVRPRAIRSPASLIDVFPTLAAHLGLSTPAGIQGHDWLDETAPRPEPPVVEIHGTAHLGGATLPARQAAIGERFKVVSNVTDGIVQVFDLERDPLERAPLSLDEVPEAAPLHRALLRWQDRPGCQPTPR